VSQSTDNSAANFVNTSVEVQDLRDFPAPAWFGEIMEEARIAHQEGRLDLSLPPGYGEPKPSSPRQRRPSRARLIAEAKKLGVDLTFEPDGAVTYHTGSAAAADGSEVKEVANPFHTAPVDDPALKKRKKRR
jgi:hypothetical protein